MHVTPLRHRNLQKCAKTQVFCTFWVANVLLATAAYNFSTLKRPKVVGDRQYFNILSCKCASRYSGVPSFHIWTSKSGPPLRCFVHFDLQMRFSPQRRAIFPHLNFKKWSKHAVFCTFWLAHVLLATAACKFSTSALQKVVRACCTVFCTFWLQNVLLATQYLIAPLNSFLRTRRFTKPTFRLSQPTNHWKFTAFRDFPSISRLLIFFLLAFAQLYLLSSDSTSLLCFFIFWLCYSALLFQLSILSEIRLLNFLWLNFPETKWSQPTNGYHFSSLW